MTDDLPVRTRLAEAVFDEHPDQIAVIDTDGVIQATNRAWETFGVENGAQVGSDMVGENYLAVCRTGDDEIGTRAADGIEAVIGGEQSTFSLEYPCHAPDEKRWFTMRVRQFEFDGDPLVLVVHADITDRYLAEQAVAERNDLLELVTGILSHDLRNPLSVALARNEMLEDAEDGHVSAVERSLERMNDIIDDALFIAREAEVADLETVALGDAAREAWSHVRTDNGVLNAPTDATISADRTLLLQLFENLFRNSIEHGTTDDADGDGAATVTLTVAVHDDGFTVADDGPGIPPDQREQVFEAGFTTDSGGSGLGLLIVREIATAHGWEIDVTDAPDGGAMFVVSGVTVND
ncbi:ATP-binding protein [Haloarcula salina]|uniref:PAS domain-containing sensor histidine kinase n=1 Tax=Haloarcula salina TaxID=1429914 RepID=UPI003C6F5090